MLEDNLLRDQADDCTAASSVSPGALRLKAARLLSSRLASTCGGGNVRRPNGSANVIPTLVSSILQPPSRRSTLHFWTCLDSTSCFLDFFTTKWGSHGPVSPESPPLPICLSSEEANRISRPVIDDEIASCFKRFANNKSLGLDGATASFYKTYWQSVGPITTSVVRLVLGGAPMSARWKSTLATLIPKRDEATSPKDFRPIRLCQTIYKVVTHILVNRIRDILPTIISLEQAPFIPDKSFNNHCHIT